MENSTIENGICVTCDRPVQYDDGSEDPVPDDICLRDKSYCTDRTERVNWRERWKELRGQRDKDREELRFVLRNLRHMYSQMVNGHVRPNQDAHTSIANGILSPQIARIERMLDRP